MKRGLSHRKTYILRWNPAISSLNLERFKSVCKKFPDGFNTDWSIFEYKDVKVNDYFYMVRVGKGKTGVVWKGVITSKPYEDDDWAGEKDKKRMYVKITVYDFSKPYGKPFITTEDLKSAIPDFDWENGHSGELLTDEQAESLDLLWDDKYWGLV